MPAIHINGRQLSHDAEPQTPLPWVLREQLGLTGTKFGCGVAQFGASTVQLDRAAGHHAVPGVRRRAQGLRRRPGAAAPRCETGAGDGRQRRGRGRRHGVAGQGDGEPTVAVAAPAVLNAIFAATGRHIRTLPLKHHGIRPV